MIAGGGVALFACLQALPREMKQLQEEHLITCFACSYWL